MFPARDRQDDDDEKNKLKQRRWMLSYPFYFIGFRSSSLFLSIMPFALFSGKCYVALIWVVSFCSYKIEAFHPPNKSRHFRRCTGVVLKPCGDKTHPSVPPLPFPGLYEKTQRNLDNIEGVESDEEVSNSTTRSFIKEFLMQPIIEVQLALLVLLSSLVVALETLQDLPPYMTSSLVLIEDFTCGIFTIEYLGRWYLSKFSLKHLFKPLVIIDLIAISPLILQALCMMGVTSLDSLNLAGGVLVNLRLFRILRLQRVLTDYETFKNFEIALGLLPSDAKPYQLQLARVVSSIFTLLSVASGLIYTAEHTVNPQIPDYFTAFYFGLTTLTTVGFGDITPVTAYGRIIVCGSILFGVAIIPAQAAALAEALLTVQKDRPSTEDSTSSRSASSSVANGSSSGDMVYGISSSLMVYGDNTNNTLEPRDTINTRTSENNNNSVDSDTIDKRGEVNARMTGANVKAAGGEVTTTVHDLPYLALTHHQPPLCMTFLTSITKPTLNSAITIYMQNKHTVHRTCNVCGSTPHRYDAVFCWGCGSPLPHDEPTTKAITSKETTTTTSSSSSSSTTTQQVRTDQDALTSV